MSPPIPPICLSCHGRPESPPNFEELSRLAQERAPESLSVEDCRFHDLWQDRRDFLEQHVSQGQVHPWWVRGNYESIRGRALPLRIQLDEASLALLLRPYSSDEVPLENLLGEAAPDPDWFGLGADAETSIEIFLNVRGGEVVFRDQDWLRSSGVLLDGPGTWNVADPQLRVDEAGMAHLEFDIPYEWWNDGHHDIVLQDDLPSQFLPWIYAVYDFQIGDWNMGEWLFPGLSRQESYPALPESLQLEAILEGLAQFLQNRPEQPPAEEPFLTRLLRHLRPDSQLSTGLMVLNDLFWPGVVDLGPSTGELTARTTETGTLEWELGQLEVNLDPMGYGPGAETGTPAVTVDGGYLRLMPGESLRGEFDPQARILSLNAPLEFEVDLTLPQLGPIRLRGNLEVQTELIFTPDGPRPVPGTTYLHLSEGELEILGEAEGTAARIVEALAPESAGLPLIRYLDLELGDGEAMQGSLASLRQMADPHGPVRWEYSLNALVGDRPVTTHGQFEIPRSSSGLYDFAAALDDSRGDFQITLPGLLENLLLQWNFHREGNRHQINGAIDLDRLHLSQSQGLPQDILLRDGRVRLSVEVETAEDGVITLRIPLLNASANPRGSGGGLLQGPLGVEQDSRRELIVRLDPLLREIQVEGARLGIHAYQVAALPPNVLNFLDPSIATLGVDGHLQADFRFSFPEDMSQWHGRGLVRLGGDSLGDVYWYDRRGRRVGPPLLRDTQWNWRRVDRINVSRGYALGRFDLGFLVNPQALMHFSEMAPVTGTRVLVDERGRELHPFEMSLLMAYDNQPATVEGFLNRIVDYLNQLHRREGRDAP